MADIEKAALEQQAEAAQEAPATETPAPETGGETAQPPKTEAESPHASAEPEPAKAAASTEQPEETVKPAADAAEAPEKQAEQAEEPPEKDDTAAKLADAELRAAAALAGIPAARIPYAVRMANAGKVTDAKTAADEIATIVRDVPELKQQAQGTGSAGNFARKDATKDPDTQAILDGFNHRF